MRWKPYLLLVSTSWLSLITLTQGAALYISEIAWMGSSTSSVDEWIEISNSGPSEVPLNGWRLSGATGNTDYTFNTSLLLPAGGAVLLANNGADSSFSGGESVLNIPPSFITSDLALGNSGQILQLLDPTGQLVDTTPSGAWAAGSNNPKITMERVSATSSGAQPAAWQNSTQQFNIDPGRSDLGTPQDNAFLPTATGSTAPTTASGTTVPEPPPTTTEPSANTESGAELPTELGSGSGSALPSGLILSEFFPNPAGSDSDQEWIELYNSSGASLRLDNISLSDSSRTYTFPDGLIVAPGEYVVVSDEATNITLNNTAESISLRFKDLLLATVSYELSNTEELSYSWTGLDWQWSTTRTPGGPNLITSPTVRTTGGGSGGNFLAAETPATSSTVQVTTDKKTTVPPPASQKKAPSLSTTKSPTTRPPDGVTIAPAKTNTAQTKAESEPPPTTKKTSSTTPKTTTRTKPLTALTGTVSGVFTKYFYLQNARGVGYKVYFYGQDLPELDIGLPIEITASCQKQRCQLTTKSTWALGSERADLTAPNNNHQLYALSQVEGTIASIKGKYLTLQTSSGSLQVDTEFLKGVDFQPGLNIKLVGIVEQSTKGTAKLLPRSPEDADITTGLVSPFVPVADAATPTATDSPQTPWGGIIFLMISLLAFGILLWRQTNLKEWWRRQHPPH